MAGTPLFNPNDNVTGRDGGPYLDEVEARSAEARRAVVEDREPDFDNPPATAGMPLVTAGRQAHMVGVNNLPSQSHNYGLSNADLVEGRAEDEERHPAFVQRGEIPGDFESDNVAVEEDAEDEGEDIELNSHDPQSPGGVDNDESDANEGEEVDALDLGFDSSYEDDASRQE